MTIDLANKIYDLFDDKLSISEFEAWVYEHDGVLEKEVEDIYMDLIAFNYRSKYAKPEFFNLFDDRIDWKRYEERKFSRMLESIIHKDSQFEEQLINTYELRCQGYRFLEELGMGYGLSLIVDLDYEKIRKEKISKQERENWIHSIYLKAKAAALQVKSWLDDGKIVLTGRQDELNHYRYTDHRTEQELSTMEKNLLEG